MACPGGGPWGALSHPLTGGKKDGASSGLLSRTSRQGRERMAGQRSAPALASSAPAWGRGSGA